MKKIYAILCLAIASLTQLQAQTPQGFNYQATVRNSSGDLIVNTNVYFKFNVIQGSQTAVPVFTETHYVPTDDLGQVKLVIGQGTANTGVFSELDWSLGSYYLGIELDTGSGYVAMGTTQLLSVPYALYAENSGNSTPTTPSLGSLLAENNSANNQQIKDLQDPTEEQDAVTLAYVLQLESQIEEINLNIDHDGDGFTENQGDCDDTNASINPGATDSSWIIGGADAIDNDCDGEIDEQDLPLELTNLLAGANEGDSKTWVWASDIPLHVGLGPVTEDMGGDEFAWESWWNNIGPNDPAKSCMYNNEFVFTQTVDGMTFEQTVGPAFVPGTYADIIGVTGDICHDETVVTTMFGVKNVSFLQSTSFAAQNGLYYNPITGDQAPYYGVSFDISDGGFMGWYVGDVIYDIISITETTMHVRFIQEGGEYAWYARYKSE